MDPDEGEFDWSQAKVVIPRSKRVASVSIDDDVLVFIKAQGRGCQTHITRLLMPESLDRSPWQRAFRHRRRRHGQPAGPALRVSLSVMQFRLGYLFA